MRISKCVGFLAIAGILVTSSSAFASDSAPINPENSVNGISDYEIMDRQAPLVEAQKKIMSAVGSEQVSSYAGSWMDAPNNSLSVYWKGEFKGPVAAAVAEIGRGGVQILVKPAKFTQKQLFEAAQRVNEDPQSKAAGVVRVMPLYDGSGLEVGIEKSEARTLNSPLQSGSDRAKDVAGVDVKPASIKRVVPYYRENDSGAMFGGGVIRSSTALCSSGFSLVWPSIGKRYLVTAKHCGAVGSSWANGQNIAIGKAEGATNDAQDGLFINVSSSGNAIWDGAGANQDGQFSKRVTKVSPNTPGEMVCTSGAITGAMCGIRVSGRVVGAYNVWVGQQVNGYVAAGQGDSGGPVFSTGNGSEAVALGIIHGGSGNQVCRSPYSGEYLCSSDIEFTDINDVVATFPGLQVQLSP
ncbi:S1 family peptidase [Streptomyces sp. G-G2]|uniref:S1 family peptidase n=1 Tax=Streptomyces sp. G-G2 TaxID=3046201 RepID=UPI0024B9E30C|nr:S1 family peptidase [Streptomyces sp. G-G2]MDJ0386391.1 S1 family peptidase [Streptomyces sp. G-G2]